MAKVPAYTPFIVPDVSASPWAVTAKEHVAAVVRWRGNSRQAKRDENSTLKPMQAWLLYQIRFLIAADLAGAWSSFGGLAAQLNHLAIVMNISIVESASVALSYDRLVREFLAGRARSRHEIAGPSFFGDFLSVENPASKLKAVAGNPRAASAPRILIPRMSFLNRRRRQPRLPRRRLRQRLRLRLRRKALLAVKSNRTVTIEVEIGSISLVLGRVPAPGVTAPGGRPLQRRRR